MTPVGSPAVSVEITSPLASHVERFPLADAAVVGRLEVCDIRLPDPRVSRRHARLSLTAAGRLVVEDLGSANGTAVGARLLRAESLATALPAVVHIDPLVLMFRRLDEATDRTLRVRRGRRLTVRGSPDGVEFGGCPVPASPRERRLIEVLAIHHPDPVGYGAIATAVWDGAPWAYYQMQNLVRRARLRLAAAGLTTDAIESVRGFGYRFALDDAEIAEMRPGT